jgi:hypothetical protein
VWDRGADVTGLLERLTRAIRRVDGRHIVVVEGNAWASDFSIFGAPWDAGLVFSFHKYWNATDEASIRPYLAYSERWSVPLWLWETGENGNQWYRETLDLVRKHEIGWCFWPWKKVWTDNCPLSVEPPADTWSRIVDYLTARPRGRRRTRLLRPSGRCCTRPKCRAAAATKKSSDPAAVLMP